MSALTAAEQRRDRIDATAQRLMAIYSPDLDKKTAAMFAYGGALALEDERKDRVIMAEFAA